MGDVVAAVDRYPDIPADVRKRLKTRMAQRDYDEIALITRNAISGRAQYDSEIREMHFGAGQICKTVTRSRWTEDWKERGLVYCEANHCIIVPTVCRNVSRVTRKDPKVASDNGRREEAVPAKDKADDLGSDGGRLAKAPSLSSLTPQGDTIDTVANAHGATGWSAWNTTPSTSGGGASSANGGDPWSPPSSRFSPISGLPVVPGGGVIDRLIAGPTDHSTHPDSGPSKASPKPGENGTDGGNVPAGDGSAGGSGGGTVPHDDISPLFPDGPDGSNVPQDLNPPTGPTGGSGTGGGTGGSGGGNGGNGGGGNGGGGNGGGNGPSGGPSLVPLSGDLTPTTGTVPEPSSAWLVLLAAGALLSGQRRRAAAAPQR